MITTGRECQRCGVWVGWIGLVVDAALVFIKLLVGYITGSRAMLADALYSIIDVVSAILVIASIRVARRGVDEEHPYGHGKVEFIAVASVSICVAVFALVLLHRVIEEIVVGAHRVGSPLAAATALVSIGACTLVYRYAACAGRRLNSPIILTHAEHNKADALSSVAVLVGIVLSWVGLGFLDPIIAVLEIVHILAISAALLRRGLFGLLDAAIDPRQIGRIRAIAHGVAGVAGVEGIRARHLGADLWIEMTVRIAATRRMADAGQVRSLVRAALLREIPHIGDVNIDVRPATPVAPTELVHLQT